jgi:hypothetical protein
MIQVTLQEKDLVIGMFLAKHEDREFAKFKPMSYDIGL